MQVALGSGRGSPRGVFVVALFAVLVALPILTIFVLALSDAGGSWPANLPRLLWTTVLLCCGTGFISLVIGTTLAWIVAFHDFPGRAALKWLALLPLALPGYITSFLFVETFTYAGPVQQALRVSFNWRSPQDYWFPDIRSIGGAAVVMALALYPYVYVAALTAFMRVPANQLYVARMLGRTPSRAFLEIALPQARPALFVGVLLVAMECLNDIGAATFFGIGTLTTAIYNTWLDQGDLTAAAQLAGLLILMMSFLVYLETVAKARALPAGKNAAQLVRSRLTGWHGAAAAAAVLMPVMLGFLLPVFLLVQLGSKRVSEVWTTETATTIVRTLCLAGIACSFAIIIALLFAYVARGKASNTVNAAIRLSSLGYALPGTVLGIGILVPFAQFDQMLDRMLNTLVGWGPGLLLSGSAFALVFAYVTRFLIIAVSQTQDGMNKIPETIDHAARTLGHSKLDVFRNINVPLLRPAILSAALLVLVDAMKELPATLILRPFDFETLATRVYALASLGQFESAAIPALLIVIAGLVPVVILARGLRIDA